MYICVRAQTARGDTQVLRRAQRGVTRCCARDLVAKNFFGRGFARVNDNSGSRSRVKRLARGFSTASGVYRVVLARSGVAAVKSHCFRYCDAREDHARERAEQRTRWSAESCLALARINAYMRVRMYIYNIYTTCYVPRTPHSRSVYTIHVIYSVSRYAPRCVYLHSLLFRVPALSLRRSVPLSRLVPVYAKAKCKCIQPHSASLVPFY